MAGRTRSATHSRLEQEANNVIHTVHTDNLNVGHLRMPFSMLTPSPTPSPEELIIKSRGRKMTPENWSPICLEKHFSDKNMTPAKGNSKNNLPIRCSPRKRLNLFESQFIKELVSNPTKTRKVSTPTKKQKLKLNFVNQAKVPLCYMLKALTKEQLTKVILLFVENHPEFQKEYEDLIPDPDLYYFEDQLCKLKSSIFQAMPRSRLIAKTDSLAFQRVAVHLQNFKEVCISQGKELVDSQSWSTVLEYVFMAWEYVRATPVWDNPPHNKFREQCFKALASVAMKALEKIHMEPIYCKDLISRFEDLKIDNQDVNHCIRLIWSKDEHQ